MIVGICFVLLCGLLWEGASHWQMRQALRWWFGRNAAQQAVQADQIQNGLMQDLFALRIGAAPASNTTLSSLNAFTTVDSLYQRLSQLSAALAPPYTSESLPLAIQCLLQQWQVAHPSSQVQFDLPTEQLSAPWMSEPPERNRTVLATVAALLQLSDPVVSVSLSLSSQPTNFWSRKPAGKAKLTIRLVYANETTGIAATRTQEFKYLRDCFRCLMPGWCRYHAQSQEENWQFCWRVSSVPILHSIVGR
jgi:hypothetical protein